MKIKLIKLLKEYLDSFGVIMIGMIAAGLTWLGCVVISTLVHIPYIIILAALFIIPAFRVAMTRLWKRIKDQRED